MTEELHTVSASQLELFQLCGWRWYYSYIENRKEPFAESAQAGTLVHDRIEKHLLGELQVNTSETWPAPSGYEYQIGAIAAAMLENIPWKFGELTKEQIETQLKLVVEDIQFTGRVDLRVDNQVWDQKTTSSLKYAKSADVLSRDVQALVYAKWALAAGASSVDLTWNYGQSKGKTDTRKVHLTLLRDDIEERFENIVMPLARDVQAAYIHKDKYKLVRNDKACFKFPPKGCPHQIRCEIAFSKMNPKLNLVDLMKQSLDPINAPEGQQQPAEPTPEELPKKARKKRDFPAEVQAEIVKALTAEPEEKQFLEDLKPIRRLFVNCIPLGENPIAAHTLISKAARTVENDLELHHVRLAPYNTGGASLAAQLRSDIYEMDPGFDLVLISRTPEGREVEATLCGLAQEVIMGL